MINISEKAKERLILLRKEENKDEKHFLRVGVAGGGCSGLSYKMDFDNQLSDEDKVFEDKGIQIVVDKRAFYIWLEQYLNFPMD